MYRSLTWRYGFDESSGIHSLYRSKRWKGIYEVKIDKCFFQGKDYKVRCFYKDEIWYFNSIQNLKKSEIIYLDFNKNDLMFFDSLCEDYFKN